MEEVLYLVQFHRKDGKHLEEYEYWKMEDAQRHFNLFRDDDSGLYCNIDLIERRIGQLDVLIQRIEFEG